MEYPLVSVIIAVYNMELYLAECLDTIETQSYRNLEIILVDDGSTDGSREICRRYVGKDRRFRLMEKDNGGLASAWNLGLSEARGEWFMFVDPDDRVDRDIIRKLLDSGTDDTDIICCCCTVLSKDRQIDDHFFRGSRSFLTFQEKRVLWGQILDPEFEHPGHKYTAIAVAWGKLYRTSLVRTHHLSFNTELRRMQDTVFNTYVFYYARRIIYLDEALYIYRFDHMSGYLSDYRDRFTIIYSCLQVARQRSFSELRLYRSAFLRRKYCEEAIFHMVLTCKYGIFIKGRSYRDQKAMFRDFTEQPCFQTVFSRYGKEVSIRRYFFDHPLRCVYYWFIVHRKTYLLHLWGKYRHLFGR